MKISMKINYQLNRSGLGKAYNTVFSLLLHYQVDAALRRGVSAVE
jgi:hypothetical protein